MGPDGERAGRGTAPFVVMARVFDGDGCASVFGECEGCLNV